MEVVCAWISHLEVSNECFLMILSPCSSVTLLVSEAIIPKRAKVHNSTWLLSNWFALQHILWFI